ncbi:hypothetical protein [Streptomyces sp. CB02130]|uniref:hypothetical protein n=1 Tax=Streptomyces sp. CB02130 TaxID=1703934 RepID=UPI0011612907|nr:hypothetical protein [Streptomyces sp. CB02130]
MKDPKTKPVWYTSTLPVSMSIMESVKKAMGPSSLMPGFTWRASQSVWALNAAVGTAVGMSAARTVAFGALANNHIFRMKPVAISPNSAAIRAMGGTYRSPFADLLTRDLFQFKYDIVGKSYTGAARSTILGAYQNPFASIWTKSFPNGSIPPMSVFDGADFFRNLSSDIATKAADLAEVLFPPNLQGFTDDEWDRLIALCAEDGIGMMFAPSTKHLRALLAAPDRAARYAYLLAHKRDLLGEISDGLDEVDHEELEDLVKLARRAVECAESGHWEGALSIAANVTNTAVEQHAISWYHEEFSSARNPQNVPITGVAGPGATIKYVVTNIPLPERRVGVFELRAHLVVRPLSSTFRHTSTGNDTFNRNAVAHTSSNDSYRDEFTVPTLLAMHSLLRGLEEKLKEDGV